MNRLMMSCSVAALTALSAPSGGRPVNVSALKMPPLAVRKTHVGVASWYGAEFQGFPTASGPPFDMNAMTCAHRLLPLGTRIRVTDLANLRSLVLKVNDRGPYIPGRVLDVSRAAAQRLGFLRAGLTPVRIEIISYPHHRLATRPGPTLVAFHAH